MKKQQDRKSIFREVKKENKKTVPSKETSANNQVAMERKVELIVDDVIII
jgi:hypothetical protein